MTKVALYQTLQTDTFVKGIQVEQKFGQKFKGDLNLQASYNDSTKPPFKYAKYMQMKPHMKHRNMYGKNVQGMNSFHFLLSLLRKLRCLISPNTKAQPSSCHHLLTALLYYIYHSQSRPLHQADIKPAGTKGQTGTSKAAHTAD